MDVFVFVTLAAIAAICSGTALYALAKWRLAESHVAYLNRDIVNRDRQIGRLRAEVKQLEPDAKIGMQARRQRIEASHAGREKRRLAALAQAAKCDEAATAPKQRKRRQA